MWLGNLICLWCVEEEHKPAGHAAALQDSGGSMCLHAAMQPMSLGCMISALDAWKARFVSAGAAHGKAAGHTAHHHSLSPASASPKNRHAVLGVQAGCAGQDGCRAGFGFGQLGGGAARSSAGKRPSRLIAAPLGRLGPAPPPLDLLCPLQTASQVGRKSSAQAWRAFASWARSWRAQWACPTRRAPPLHTAGQRPRLPPPSGLPRSITRVRQRCLPVANVLSCQSCGSSLLRGLPSTTRCVTRHSQHVPAALPALLCFVELRPREKANET